MDFVLETNNNISTDLTPNEEVHEYALDFN